MTFFFFFKYVYLDKKYFVGCPEMFCFPFQCRANYLRCVWHEKLYLVFCLAYMCIKQFENLKSLKIFQSVLFRQIYVRFRPKKSHFKPKLACFEQDKIRY